MIGPFDEQTAELGGGAIALLALGAGAFALSRRKKRQEAEWDEEPAIAEPEGADETMQQHAPAATNASAFAWGNSPHSREQQSADRSDGGSWVERAYRGPSPDNPSLSLKTRLKRAAFFDKREREAAAGNAAPVEAEAGLPEAMVEERDLERA